MKLASHFHEVRRLRMRGIILPLSTCLSGQLCYSLHNEK
jgi:hypothetical protein